MTNFPIMKLLESGVPISLLLDLAGRHRETVFAVHTHTQRAQPSTVAHYLLAVVEQLSTMVKRLEQELDAM